MLPTTTAPALTLLQLALALACLWVELAPRIKTPPLATAVLAAVCFGALLRIACHAATPPAGVLEYLITGLLLWAVIRYALTRQHRQPPTQGAGLNPWRITP